MGIIQIHYIKWKYLNTDVISVNCVMFSGKQVFNKQQDELQFMDLLFLVIANDNFKRNKKTIWPKGKTVFKTFMTSVLKIINNCFSNSPALEERKNKINAMLLHYSQVENVDIELLCNNKFICNVYMH